MEWKLLNAHIALRQRLSLESALRDRMARTGVVKASALTVTLTVMASLSGCGLDGSPLSGEKPLADKVSVTEASDSDLLNRVLDQQSDSVETRYAFRHPAETLSFFGIKPGMTVVETDPGGGW